MKLGIYGGTFDPPHRGHMEAASVARSALGLDKILFIPAARPPHKSLPAESALPQHRMAMTRLMADGLTLRHGADSTQTLGLELERGGVSYTVDTLKELKRTYPDAELWLLMGADMLFSLPDWHDTPGILALAKVAAFARSNQDDPAQMAQFAQELESDGTSTVKIIPLPQVVEVSSTQLRNLMVEAPEQVSDFLWEQVHGYILRHKLYGTRAELQCLSMDELRVCAWSMVYARRIPHIKGCEEEAGRLAAHWGADPVKARRAAILHDCTKYLTVDEHLAICQKYGYIPDKLEATTGKLLHAKTGALLAKYLYGEERDICHAIRWHTTGREDMTTLEKIIYMADYIEPSRADLEGLAELRDLAYRNLDKAVLLGCELTIADMNTRGMEIHPHTKRARDWLKGQRTNE